ncbi:MAG: cytochrome c family protein [Vicinamibacterales bacterium]
MTARLGIAGFTGFLIASFCASAAAAEAPDPESGRSVFQLCQACHSTKPGGQSIGPTLFGVVGRRAGSVEGFDYSPAMKGAARTWNRKTLDAYLTNPATSVPGNKMALVGIPDPRDRADLIAYLAQLGPKKP